MFACQLQREQKGITEKNLFRQKKNIMKAPEIYCKTEKIKCKVPSVRMYKMHSKTYRSFPNSFAPVGTWDYYVRNKAKDHDIKYWLFSLLHVVLFFFMKKNFISFNFHLVVAEPVPMIYIFRG